MKDQESKEIVASDQSGVGARIKARREERGLTSSALAELAKVSRGYLSQIEGGDVDNPSAAVLFRIAKTLGTNVAALLGEQPEEHSPQPSQVDPALMQFAHEAKLSQEDINMLAGIKHRGGGALTKEDWRFMYEAIRRTIEPRENK
jgi:transcriptional regulator with XRE-family HTH domain